MAKTKDLFVEKILPPVVGAVVGGIAGALVTGFMFYLVPSVFGLRHEVSINEFVTAVNQSLKPQFDELKTNVGNITGEFIKLENRATALEAKLEAIDNYLVKEFRVKAEKILGTSNVAIVRTNAAGLTSDPATLWIPYKDSKEQKVYAITYTAVEIKEDFLVVRSTIRQSDGKVLDDKPIKMRLPSDVGKSVTYSPRLQGMGASTVTFQLGLLERLSPTDLILATGIKGPSTS
ncbi:MAG TPA: hypothetical protein VEG60_07160 [Candidatus Binatia bacterium]|nr:hypothetical protein [Candidatus Binatia bacterium]